MREQLKALETALSSGEVLPNILGMGLPMSPISPTASLGSPLSSLH